jgi:hypothetical protein
MIITASRRTDIPAFYSEWFMNRVRDGYALVPNPLYPESVSRVSLVPGDVSAIIFCTKNPGPMIGSLEELESSGFKYIFQVTLTGYPPAIEPNVPPTGEVINSVIKIVSV